MQIIKYASSSCVKCKVLDRTLKGMKLPCEVETIYVDVDDISENIKSSIETLPTLKISNNENEVILKGLQSPKQIQEAIEQLG